MLIVDLDKKPTKESLGMIFKVSGDNLDRVAELTETLKNFPMTGNTTNLIIQLPIMEGIITSYGYVPYVKLYGGVFAFILNTLLWTLERAYRLNGQGYVDRFNKLTVNE